MSIFGPVDDTDRRRWQQRDLKGLTELIQFGATKNLPPLRWRLTTSGGGIIGEVDLLYRDRDPHEVFEAWCEALSEHKRVDPRGGGFRGEGKPRTEHTLPGGKIRLWAGFTLRLTDGKHPVCDVTLLAEWFAEDFAEAVSP